MPRGQDIVDDYIPDLIQRCRKHKGKNLSADVDGTVAGYILILCEVVSEGIDDGDMEFGLIGDLVVVENLRNKGYGKQLRSAAENEAMANDVRWLRIGVLSSNRVASDLYLSNDFRPCSAQLEKVLS